MAKLTEARRRTLQYMADFDCMLTSANWSTAWTYDAYQWPVSGQVTIALSRDGLIERDPSSNQFTRWRITEAGRRLLTQEDGNG